MHLKLKKNESTTKKGTIFVNPVSASFSLFLINMSNNDSIKVWNWSWKLDLEDSTVVEE